VVYDLPYEAASRDEAAEVLKYYLGHKYEWHWMFAMTKPGYPVGKYYDPWTRVELETLGGDRWRISRKTRER
jgi:hypothetical protein